MRKVASFVVPNMLPYLFAEMAIAACWWFKNDRGGPASLAWEANGPGYWTQKRSDLLGPYREALMEGQYVNPSAAKLEELQLRQYSTGPDGEPFHNAEN